VTISNRPGNTAKALPS